MAAPAEVQELITRLFHALFSGDLRALRAVALDHPKLDVLLAAQPRIEDLDNQIGSLQMHVIAEYPDGHLLVHVYFMGTVRPTTLVRVADGSLRADLRWWLSTAEPRTELFERARAALYAMITGNAGLLEATCLPDPELPLLLTRPAPAGEHGQYEDVCAFMPMIQLAEGEMFPWPGGQMFKADATLTTGDRRLLMAQFGEDEITFKMQLVAGEWRVDPSPFISMAKLRGSR